MCVYECAGWGVAGVALGSPLDFAEVQKKVWGSFVRDAISESGGTSSSEGAAPPAAAQVGLHMLACIPVFLYLNKS